MIPRRVQIAPVDLRRAFSYRGKDGEGEGMDMAGRGDTQEVTMGKRTPSLLEQTGKVRAFRKGDVIIVSGVNWLPRRLKIVAVARSGATKN